MQEVTEFHSGQKVPRVEGCSLFLLLVFNFEIPHGQAVYFVQGHLEPESAFCWFPRLCTYQGQVGLSLAAWIIRVPVLIVFYM